MGHEVVFAFRDLYALGARPLEGFEWFPAPLLQPPATPNRSPLNASDILLNLGYQDSAGLAGALRAWQGLFALWRADIVACDYAPTALLAARASRLKRLSLGSGFSMPAPSEPLAALRDWIPTEQGALERIDRRLLGHVAEALGALHARMPAAPRAAHEIFSADTQLLCTFAEIDPFGPRPGAEYLGAVSETAGVPMRWEARAGARLFAYLKPRDSRFSALIQALGELPGQAIVAAPGLSAEGAAKLSSAHVRVLGESVDLQALLPTADLCLCHAGTGLVSRALLAGVPLALLPMQLEQYLIARRLAAGGTAALLSPEERSPDFASWFATLLEQDDMRRAARAFADTHRDHSFELAAANAARRIVAALEHQ